MGENTAICVLEDPMYPGSFTVVPRKMVNMELQQVLPELEEEWSFETSVFKGFARDRESAVEQCFEVDWAHGRAEQIIRVEAKRREVRSVLQRHFFQIMLTYWKIAFLGYQAGDEAVGVSLAAFRLFLGQAGGNGRKKLVDGEKLKLGDLDCIFTAAHVVERDRLHKFTVLPRKRLSRFQFVEAIVRVSLRRYVHDDLASGMFRESVEDFLRTTLLGQSLVEMRQGLHEILFKEVCCLAYQEHLDIIRAVFEAYSARNRHPGMAKRVVPTLSYAAWVSLVRDASVLASDGFHHDHIATAFVIGKELRADETSGWRHMELSWSEFLVALGALVRLGAGDSRPFEDQLDDFFMTYMDDLHRNLSSRTKKSEDSGSTGEHRKLLRCIERLFLRADNGRTGRIKVDDLRELIQEPFVLLDLAAGSFTKTQVQLLLETLSEEYPEDSDGDMSLDVLVASVLKLKETVKSMERAISPLERAFDEIDEGSGAVPIADLKSQLQTPSLMRKLVPAGLSTHDMRFMFRLLEEADVTTVTMQDIVKTLLKARDPQFAIRRGLDTLGRYFEQADIDDSGGLSREEVMDTLTTARVCDELAAANLENPDWEVLFDELDVDGSGDLSWEEIEDGMTLFWQSNKLGWEESP